MKFGISLRSGPVSRLNYFWKGVIQHVQHAGFTRLDLLMILAGCALLVLIATPVLAKNKPRSDMASCANNLRQIGVGWRLWAEDHDEQVPWHVVTANGGTYRVAAAWVHFAVASNYFSSPRLLVCPTDTTKMLARDFSANTNGGFAAAAYQDKALSYFLGTEAGLQWPNMLFAGDHYLNGGSTATCGSVGVEVLQLRTRATWWQTNGHGGMGNLLLTQGSVLQTSDFTLQQALQETGLVDGNKSNCTLQPD